MKICLECSEGGHLDEMISLIEAFSSYDVFFVMVRVGRTEDLGKKYRVKFIKYKEHHGKADVLRDLFSLLPFCLNLIFTEKPNAIVSTGGNVTIPLSYLGKLFGIKIIYIESLTRIKDISGTGKIIYPIADLFIVQWKSLLLKYKKAKYWGKVV